MTYRPAPVPPGVASAPAIEARLEPDAISVARDTVIGMASSAPAGTMAATLAAASAYRSGPVLILTALPMLVIANSYRRLNPWSALGWRLVRLRLRRAWRRLRPGPGPSCCGTPGRCSR
jgi:hypothetical protein